MRTEGRGATLAAVERLEPRQLLAAADPDPAFGAGGVARVDQTGSAIDSGTAIHVLDDGRALVGARAAPYRSYAALARYLPNGQLDPTFGDGGRVHTSLRWANGVEQIGVGSDGSIIAGGTTGGGGAAVQRFTADGAVDPTWVGPGTLIGMISGILVLDKEA